MQWIAEAADWITEQALTRAVVAHALACRDTERAISLPSQRAPSSVKRVPHVFSSFVSVSRGGGSAELGEVAGG